MPIRPVAVIGALVAWSVAWWAFLRSIWELDEPDELGINAAASTWIWILGLVGVLVVWGVVEALRYWHRATRPPDIANPS
jgi:hypothetical protein